jgi:hypothetical protein
MTETSDRRARKGGLRRARRPVEHAVLLAAGLATLSAPQAAAADAHPCDRPVSRAWSTEPVQRCALIAPESGDRIPVYANPVSRRMGAALPSPDGWLEGTAGQYFVCETRTSKLFYHRRGWRNDWWAYTAADRGVAWGWVPEVYFRGGDDDEPDAGLRGCGSSTLPGGGLEPEDRDRRPIPKERVRQRRSMPHFQLPFKCGQRWQLNTWAHSPALDMVKEPDQHGTLRAQLRAAAAGTVSISGWDSGGGNVVQIRHRSGWFSTYIHLTRRSVKVGQKLKRGAAIGTVGKTGSMSRDHPHLHFEIARSKERKATWGFVGADRVAAYFNGRRYTGEDKEWSNVVSHNCIDNEAVQQNPH